MFEGRTSAQYSLALAALAFLFLLRVVGQMLVAFFDVSFLPPMAQWYSGLLPYPALLPVQLLILVLQTRISADLRRGRGFFTTQRPRFGVFLCRFSYVYFTAMLLRYVLTMWLYPERRWFYGTIPIVFHWVLAAYLYVLGRYNAAGPPPRD